MIQTLERDWLGAWQERREERMEVGACKLGWNPRRAWASGARTDELEGGKHQEREVSERRALGLGGGVWGWGIPRDGESGRQGQGFRVRKGHKRRSQTQMGM